MNEAVIFTIMNCCMELAENMFRNMIKECRKKSPNTSKTKATKAVTKTSIKHSSQLHINVSDRR